MTQTGVTYLPIDKLSLLAGAKGKTISPLQPVGICEFDDKRIACISQAGLVEADEQVLGLEIQRGNLIVRPIDL